MGEKFDAMDIIRTMNSRKALLIQIVIAFTVIAFLASIALRIVKPVYEAEAVLMFSSGDSYSSATLSSLSSLFGKGDVDVLTKTKIIPSPAIAKLAAAKLGTDYEALLSKVEVEVIPESTLVSVKGRADTGKGASEIANAFVSAYINWERGRLSRSLKEQKKIVDGTITANEAKLAAITSANPGDSKISTVVNNPTIIASVYGNLVQRSNDLAVNEKLLASGTQVVFAAEQPKAPVAPRVLMNTILGFVAGVLTSIIVLFFSHFLEIIRNADD